MLKVGWFRAQETKKVCEVVVRAQRERDFIRVQEKSPPLSLSFLSPALLSLILMLWNKPLSESWCLYLEQTFRLALCFSLSLAAPRPFNFASWSFSCRFKRFWKVTKSSQGNFLGIPASSNGPLELSWFYCRVTSPSCVSLEHLWVTLKIDPMWPGTQFQDESRHFNEVLTAVCGP